MVVNRNASLVIESHEARPFYAAKFRVDGRQVKRRIGPAWLDRGAGGWRPRKGRIQDGYFDERRAHVRAAEIVAGYRARTEQLERLERERKTRGATFREVAHGYLRWLEDVKGAKPSTLADHRWLLREPGVPYKRGQRVSNGHIMAALGDLPAAQITARDIEQMLSKVAGSPATVNKHRATVSAIFSYANRESSFDLPANPARKTDKRREAQPGALVFYSPSEIEALARALPDQQDAELVRVAAYAGLRMGELLALRWRDVDFAARALTVSRAISAGVESSTKSGKVRRVTMPDQVAAALGRLRGRERFTQPNDLVFVNDIGRTLDGSALRRRYKAARHVAGLRPLRFHDLRHTYGSLLAAAGVDLVTIQAAMGHSAISTTSRYLHARPASQQAAAFTEAFDSFTPATDVRAPGAPHDRNG